MEHGQPLHLPGEQGPPGAASGFGQMLYWAAQPQQQPWRPDPPSPLPPSAPLDHLPPLAHATSGPPVFFTAGELTLESGSPTKSSRRDQRWSSGSVTGGAAATPGPSLPAFAPQHPQHPQHQHHNHHLQQMEARNAELLHHCQELQARLEAATAAAERQASLVTHQQQQRPGRAAAAAAEEAEPGELAALQRRLAAKAREAAAAAQAAEAAQAALQQRDAELEGEREKAAALTDEVSRWRDECVQKERETRAIAQRLEAATTHGGLLDDTMAALKRQVGEMSTALAERDVAIRQLEDRLRTLQGSEGGKDRQLEALHGELDAARGEREALRRECAALQQQNRELDAEVRHLGAALQQAAKEQAAALRSHSRDLELIAAVPPQQPQQTAAAPASGRASSNSGSPAGGFDRYGYAPLPLPYGQPPAAYGAQSPVPQRYTSYYAEAGGAAPASFDWASAQQAELDPRASLLLAPYGAPLLTAQAAQQQQYAWQDPAVSQDVRASYAHQSSSRGAFQRHNQWTPAAGVRSAPSVAGSDACSLTGYGGIAAPRALPLPQQAWEGRSDGGFAGTGVSTPYQQQQQQQKQGMDEALTGRLRALALHTPISSNTSPFGTDDTLQDMLARTQALEDHLLQLNAERNELEAETSRMPSHTSGRTVQERKRRAEVEARLEALNKECSSVRLQLRRLGVK